MVDRRWLWDAADELLAAWYPPGVKQNTTGPDGRTRKEHGEIPDLVRVQRAYDKLLWEIVTSPAPELATFASRFFEEPYINLPPPLQVTVWRLVGLEVAGGVEQLRAAVAGIACYCSPAEEAGAVGGIESRIRSLGG